MGAQPYGLLNFRSMRLSLEPSSQLTAHKRINMKTKVLKTILLLISIAACNLKTAYTQKNNFQKIEGINYSEVTITDSFWLPKIHDVAKNALSVCVYQSEVATPRIRNFEKVAAADGQKHEGIYYDDSDVYKALEAIAYSLHTVPDAKLEAKADEWIDKIAAAQLEDGYLNTFYTLEGLENRWTDMERHEAYCAGHLIEAAIAYYEATGKRALLDVAIRLADHLDAALRQAGKPWVAGHQEIELALVKLSRTTDNSKYLDLAEWFLEQRGHGHGVGKIWDEWKDPGYAQDALPVKEQTEITGHAVRAMYMYTGIADIAAITEDQAYIETMLKVWEDVVHRNTYVTGGIGAGRHNEGFDRDFILPNEEAYCETCAAVGMVFWNQRMNWLTGEAKYMDVLERSLYNSALDGISLDGKQFFYPNPLASSGQHQRKDWFGTACCPSNISRLISSLGNYIYGKSDDGIWINLFVGSSTKLTIAETTINISLETPYPMGNAIKVLIDPERTVEVDVHLRLPGWSGNEAMPGDLYFFTDRSAETPTLLLNGNPVEYEVSQGYAVISRRWAPGSKLTWVLPMKPRLVKSRDEVEDNHNKVALQYGPLVYCFEDADNAIGAEKISISSRAKFQIEPSTILDEPILSLTTNMGDGNKIEAIPYYTWCNRGSNGMRVWIPVN